MGAVIRFDTSVGVRMYTYDILLTVTALAVGFGRPPDPGFQRPPGLWRGGLEGQSPSMKPPSTLTPSAPAKTQAPAMASISGAGRFV